MGRKSLLLLALLILGLGGAYFWLQKPASVAVSRVPLLPSLQGRLAEVSAVEVDSPEQTPVRLERREQTWVVPAKAGYPASVGAVNTLLRALGEAQKAEAKTSNPQLHERLGLAERGEQRATRINLELPGAPPLALLVGKPAQQGSGQLVRLVGDNQVWLIDKPINLPVEELQWLDRRVAAIPFASVKRLEVRYADGQRLTLLRAEADEPNFRLAQLPAGKPLPYEAAANGMVNLFGRLDFADAAPLTQVQFKAPALLNFVLESFADGQVQGAVYVQGEQYWLTLKERRNFSAEELPGKADWAYRIEPGQYQALAKTLKDVLAKK
ncbi:DUF4340 domain-containing protein [Pseudomonas cavernae]|uniref:DUF4340 domain-containing protein n=1 Tax=Pseudomonas cavernae TaxID=2320867 RepID=A0A385Z003_9PSED|nr:DUF4340 domain-containing protein [Pseudomonas cavernae]AYC32064.1 DUF4340 domain-containing protein [Pseudomonas cavernae]